MKHILILIAAIFLFACNAKEEEKAVVKKSNVYQPSEMAELMLQMYDVNLENKKLILAGKKPTKFQKEFLNIHSAKLTDPTDRNPSFNAFSDFYLETYQQIFNSSRDSLAIKHNNTINSCIACHKTTCIGPIPRIKKLLIQ